MKESGLSWFVEKSRCSFTFRLSSWAILITILLSSSSMAGGTTPQMIQSWKDKSNQGDVYAPFQLGYCYQEGQGVKRNLVEAAKWYKLGAERGHIHAALMLADMYLKGEGVQRDEEKAIAEAIRDVVNLVHLGTGST
jgi:TPR repeat protein